MYATDYVQIYTLMNGFYLNNKVLESLMMLGIHYIPIAYMFISNIAKVKKAGEDEGDAGGLLIRYTLVDLIRICLIFLIFLYPIGAPITVNTSSILKSNCPSSNGLVSSDIAWNDSIDNIVFKEKSIQSEVEDEIFSTGSDAKPPPDNTVYFAGIEPKAPIGLAIAHNLTVVASSMIVSAIPCSTDLRTITLQNAVAQLPDMNSSLQESFSEFFGQCYQPNLRDLIQQTTVSTYDLKNKLWPGAGVFSSQSGLYTTNAHYLTLPKTTWNRVKQIEYGNPSPTLTAKDDPSNPNNYLVPCGKAYDSLTKAALKERKAQLEVDSSLFSYITDLYRNVSGWTQAKQDETDLKILFEELAYSPVSNSNVEVPRSQNTPTKKISEDIGEIGLYVSRAVGAAESHVAKVMAPISFSIIGMILVLLFPALVILSGYNPKVVFSLLAGVIVCSTSGLMISVAEYIDTILIPLIQSQANSQAQNTSVISNGAMAYLGTLCYQYLPLVWVVLFGTIGAAVNSVAAGSLTNASKGTGAAATKAAGGIGKLGIGSFIKPKK